MSKKDFVSFSSLSFVQWSGIPCALCHVVLAETCEQFENTIDSGVGVGQHAKCPSIQSVYVKTHDEVVYVRLVNIT